jgi:lipase
MTSTSTDPPDAARADPFVVQFDVPVEGGELAVFRAGPAPDAADAVALALHGITSSHMTYRGVARRLVAETGICLLAPDLRGRGRSAGLGGPYGLATHVADLVAVLDRAGARRVVVVGHSMGAYIAARLAADHPDRVSSVVLLDAGLPFPEPPEDPDAVFQAVVGPALERLHLHFDTIEEYVDGWRRHPAFANTWNDDVEAYARYDMVSDGRSVRCIVSEDAVRIDGRDLLLDDASRTALGRVTAPIHLMRAPRGLLDDDDPLLPRAFLDPFLLALPAIRLEEIPDVNHYTIVMGDGPGPARVAATIAAAATEG